MPTSAYTGHYPRPLLLRQSSSWLHWVEPTRILGVLPTYYTRANQGFPRSEPSFVAALGWYFTPGYFSCENRPYYGDDPSLLDSGHKTIHLSPFPFWSGLSIRVGLSGLTTLQTSLSGVARAASRAGDCLIGFDAYLHSSPLSRLMSSLYGRASAIGAHIVGKELHLTSVVQLASHF